MRKVYLYIGILLLLLCFAGCGNNRESISDVEYNDTKSEDKDINQNTDKNEVKDIGDNVEKESGVDITAEEKANEVINNMVSDFFEENDLDNLDIDIIDETASDKVEMEEAYTPRFDYEIFIDGVSYKLPMYVSDLMALGWEVSEYYDIYEGVNPYTAGSFFIFKNKDYELLTSIINYDVNQKPAIECVVGEIRISCNNADSADIKTQNDIKLGVTKPEDVLELFGEPDYEYNFEEYHSRSLEYREDVYNYLKFTFDGEENMVLTEIEIDNYREPDGFEASEVDKTYIPQATSAYISPSEITDNIEDYIFELDGELYKLPCPVQAFIDNGWEIVKDKSKEIVYGYGVEWVTLEKNGVEISGGAYNYDKNGTVISNCFIDEIRLSRYYLEEAGMSGSIFKEVSVSSTEEDAWNFLKTKGFEYSEDNLYIQILGERRKSWYSLYINEQEVRSISIKNSLSVKEYEKSVGIR